jgi:hypothetical protein
MKRYKPAFKQIIKEDEENDKSIKAIKDLIDLDWEKDEDAQHQALAMIKGLVLADTKSADKFLTDLSTYTSKMSIEDYSGKQEEECKKKPKKKGMKEATVNINNLDSAMDAISYGVDFIGSKVRDTNPKFSFIVAKGIIKGVKNVIAHDDLNDESEVINAINRIIKYMKLELKQG